MRALVVLGLPSVAFATPNTAPNLPDVQVHAGVEDQLVVIAPTADDPDGDPVTFTLVNAPTDATVVSIGEAIVLQPNPNFNGRFWFSIRASDGHDTSTEGWVSVDVAAAQDPLDVAPIAVSADEDDGARIELAVEAPDGVTVAWEVLSPPSHGVLVGPAASGPSTDGVLGYVPERDYVGADAFTVAAIDVGSAGRFPAEVSVDVTPAADPPGPIGALFPTHGATIDSVRPMFQWTAALDVDGDVLRYEAVLTRADTDEQIASAFDLRAVDGVVAWTSPVELEPGGAYTLRMWAWDGVFEGPTLGPVDFVVDDDNLAPVGLAFAWPATGDLVDGVSPVIELLPARDPEGGAVSYAFEADASPLFDTDLRLAAVTTAPAWDLGAAGLALPRYRDVWVRARATDAAGVSGPWRLVMFETTGDNHAPSTPDVDRVESAGAPCLVLVRATDSDRDAVRFEITTSPSAEGAFTGFYPAINAKAVVGCPFDELGAAQDFWVRAHDEIGATSTWRWVKAPILRTAGTCDHGAGGGGLVGLLVAAGLARRRRG